MLNPRAPYLAAILLGLSWLLVPRYHGVEASKTSGAKQVAKARDPANKKVNINQATSEELQTLPGIGPAIAQRILQYRRKNPPFRKVEELLIIKGISPGRLKEMKDRIRLE